MQRHFWYGLPNDGSSTKILYNTSIHADGGDGLHITRKGFQFLRKQQRVDGYSTEAQVYQEGTNRINIEIPGVSDANTILEELGKPGSLQFQLEDGTVVNCAIITILTVEAKDYIVLLPLDEDGENEDGEVWFYGYSENPDDPNEEPILAYIEDDDVYEKVADAFDEYLDSCEFDEIIDDNDSEE